MLFNIVGHKIDCNYETWKKYGAKTMRRRLAPGRAPSFPHPGVRRFSWCSSNNAHIFFIFHIFLKQLLTLWYKTYFSTTWFYGICVNANPSYQKCCSPLEAPSCPRLPYLSTISFKTYRARLTKSVQIKFEIVRIGWFEVPPVSRKCFAGRLGVGLSSQYHPLKSEKKG